VTIAQSQPVLYAADLGGCAALAALSCEEVAATFAAVVESAGATIVRAVSHAFPGVGLTSVLILSESHAILHTWPESGTVHVDIFSCSARLRIQEAIDGLSCSFGARHVSVKELARADGHRSSADGRG